MVDDIVVSNDEEDIVTNQRFITRIFYEKNNEIIGCEIVLYDDNTNIIDTIEVTDAKTIIDLKDEWEHIKDYYVLRGDVTLPEKLRDNVTLQDILRNENGETNIVATKLYENDYEYSANDFASAFHNHNGLYCEKFHASMNDEYGVGKEDYFGHVRIIDNLDENIFVQGNALSSYQGYLLNNKVNDVQNEFKWSALKSIGSFIKYRVNRGLRLVVCNYNRKDYTGLNSSTGVHVLHKEGTIPDDYAPAGRCISPLYRGDVVLYFNSDGSVKISNLNKIQSMDIYGQVMWYY